MSRSNITIKSRWRKYLRWTKNRYLISLVPILKTQVPKNIFSIQLMLPTGTKETIAAVPDVPLFFFFFPFYFLPNQVGKSPNQNNIPNSHHQTHITNHKVTYTHKSNTSQYPKKLLKYITDPNNESQIYNFSVKYISVNHHRFF